MTLCGVGFLWRVSEPLKPEGKAHAVEKCNQHYVYLFQIWYYFEISSSMENESGGFLYL
jgi:hypothetical protein